MLGEPVVVVGWVSGWEEDHVIVVTEGHELQTPKLDHRSQRKWTFGVSHPEEWWENDVDTRRAPTWRANCRCLDPGGPLTDE
jgi:hypothetical protein